ncbi:hypothetical protein [Glutamicibacter sp. FBE19]|uniref:hypothetical protein n=1 Tax=Glutamicibacter sp. FBE19 TaxID=2761534 RepID=UPI001896943B|nr:hypothetical protein [Glutamicibacter sp. FBE19]MBF6672249.1 hypothetical protein [Glutamicibacter sp. FBE19]
MMAPYLVAAIAASVGYGSASVLEALAARRVGGSRIFTHPLYLAGLALDALSWLASLIALQALTLFTVQAVLSSSLIVTILLSRWAFAARLRASALWVMGLMVLGLVFLAWSTGPQRAAAPPLGFIWAMVIASLALGATVAAGYRKSSPILMSIMGGLAASIAALAARGLQLPDSLWAIPREPMAWLVLGNGVIAILAYTRALEGGDVGPMTAVFTAIEVVVPGIAGMMVFGDAARPGWEGCKFAALALSMGCGLWLAFQPGADPNAVGKQKAKDLRGAAGA